MMKGRIRVLFYVLKQSYTKNKGEEKKRIDFDLLPEERHLSYAETSHYSSLFVIRFPIARETYRQAERESKKKKKKKFFYVTHEQGLSII